MNNGGCFHLSHKGHIAGLRDLPSLYPCFPACAVLRSTAQKATGIHKTLISLCQWPQLFKIHRPGGTYSLNTARDTGIAVGALLEEGCFIYFTAGSSIPYQPNVSHQLWFPLSPLVLKPVTLPYQILGIRAHDSSEGPGEESPLSCVVITWYAL